MCTYNCTVWVHTWYISCTAQCVCSPGTSHTLCSVGAHLVHLMHCTVWVHTWYISYTAQCGCTPGTSHALRSVGAHLVHLMHCTVCVLTWYISYTVQCGCTPGTSHTLHSVGAHLVHLIHCTVWVHTWYISYTAQCGCTPGTSHTLRSVGAHLVHLIHCAVWVASWTSQTLFSLLLCVARREDSLSSSVDGPPPQDAGLETLPSSDFGRLGSTRPPPAQHNTCLHNTHLHTLITTQISVQRSPSYKQDTAGAALWGFFGQCLCDCLYKEVLRCDRDQGWTLVSCGRDQRWTLFHVAEIKGGPCFTCLYAFQMQVNLANSHWSLLVIPALH